MQHWYCSVQCESDGNNFWGDVVLDSFNKAWKDEDNILDKIYKFVRNFILMILVFYNIIRKCKLTLE